MGAIETGIGARPGSGPDAATRSGGAERADGADGTDDATVRLASRAFVAALVVAAPVLLRLGNQRWFSTDEWGFLVSYSLDDPGGWLAPQNGHWSTLPMLAYQGLYEVIGLRSYAAFQAMSVATHLLAVVVVRAVMRRAGVRPWVATLAALSLLLFGHGQQNIFVAIQISFVGAFVLGVSQVLLADHDGPIAWRDGLGVLAGIAALACSAVGVAMIPVVAVAVLLRRGWRVAALHVVPVVVVYGIWFSFERPRTTAGTTDAGPLESLGNILRWDLAGEVAAFRNLAANSWLGAVLAGVAVAGLVVAWRGRSWTWFRRTQGGPVALLVGGLAFLTLTGASRWMFVGTDAAGTQSRYQYMVAAFTIAALGVAFDALAQRWRIAIPALAGLFVIGLVGNVLVFREPSNHVGPQYDHQRDVVLGVARSPLAAQVNPALRPNSAAGFFLDVGFLLRAAQEGKLPEAGPIDPDTEAEIAVRLGFSQSFSGPVFMTCEQVASATITPVKGAVHRIDPGAATSVEVQSVDAEGKPTSPEVTFLATQGLWFVAELPDQRLAIRSTRPGATFQLCS